MAATVRITAENLVVDIHGMDRFWALKSHLSIPISHVRGATAGRGTSRTPRGWRVPGTYLPGVITAGTYRKDGHREFWLVHHMDKSVVIDLHDDFYERLVIEVDDPIATIELVQGAVARR